jgi:hypothetical protein
MDCGAGWYPARRLPTGAGGPVYRRSGRVTNPPQVTNLPHNFRRIPVPGKTKWHWAARHGQIRILDESGEDYLYPQVCFLPIKLPQAAGQAILKAS